MNFSEFFKGKKILITGNTGFKGSWLSQILLNYGAIVVGYSLTPNTNPNMFEVLELDKTMKTYYCDIRDSKKLKEVMSEEKPEIVFHLAAQPIVRRSYDEPLYTFETNIMGTANVLDAIRDAKCVKSVVMITTDKVYENKEHIWPYRETDALGGKDPYSASKACAELAISCYIQSYFPIAEYGKTHNTLIAVARSGNVIGGGDWAEDRLIPDIIRSIIENDEDVIIRNPESTRPWQHVLEPLSGYLLLSKELFEKNIPIAGPWNFAPDYKESLSVHEIVKKGIDILQKGNYAIKEEKNKKHESKLLTLDSTKARTVLGWNHFIDINQRLYMTFYWYNAHYDNKDVKNLTNEQISDYMNNFEKN